MAGGALALDNSSTGITQAFSSLNKALVGDASDEARAGYYGSEIAINRQKAEDLRRQALGRQSLADLLAQGVTGPRLYGAMAFDPNYLQIAPKINLGETTLAPGMTVQSPAVQLAQVGSGEGYQSTYGGVQDALKNALAQAGVHAAATRYSADVAANERRFEFGGGDVRVRGPQTGNETLVKRSDWMAHPELYGAPLSAPQAEVNVATTKPMPVRIPDTRPGAPPGAMIDTFAPTGTVSQAAPGAYAPPLTEPQVSQQRAADQNNQWLDTTIRVKDSADGLEKEITRRTFMANPNRFLAPASEAQVAGDKAQQETRTAAQQPFKVDKAASEALHQQVLDQLDAALGLQRDSHGMGGLMYGVDPGRFPGLDIGKIEARASEIYQLTGDAPGATRAAIMESVGSSPQRPGGWWWSPDYKPGGTVPGPEVKRDESGQVMRPPAVTTRSRTDTNQPKPYEPPKIVPIEPPAPPAPAAPAGPGGTVAQQDIAPEQKVAISRSMENVSPADAKASAARMIKQKPQLRAAIISLLRQHNIDTSGL